MARDFEEIAGGYILWKFGAFIFKRMVFPGVVVGGIYGIGAGVMTDNTASDSASLAFHKPYELINTGVEFLGSGFDKSQQGIRNMLAGAANIIVTPFVVGGAGGALLGTGIVQYAERLYEENFNKKPDAPAPFKDPLETPAPK